MSKVIFQGECHRIILSARNADSGDKHVAILCEVEDDGNWSVQGSGFSSYWLPEYIMLLKQAMEYIEKNCVESEDGYGWRFKNEND